MFWRLKGKWERGHHSKGRREGPQQASEGPDESEGEPGAHLGDLTRASELMVLSCLFRDDLRGVYPRARKFPSRNFPLSSREELPGKFLGSSEAFYAIWKLPAVRPWMCTGHVENLQISWVLPFKCGRDGRGGQS